MKPDEPFGMPGGLMGPGGNGHSIFIQCERCRTLVATAWRNVKTQDIVCSACILLHDPFKCVGCGVDTWHWTHMCQRCRAGADEPTK